MMAVLKSGDNTESGRGETDAEAGDGDLGLVVGVRSRTEPILNS
jgi:hypothetical protein